MEFKIYLAGPDVFLPNAKEAGESLKQILASKGMIGLYPLDNEFTLTRSPSSNGSVIARGNVALIQQCHGILGNLRPFRGPSADTGTVWECAYGKGLGRIVVGYNIDFRFYKDKVVNHVPHDGMVVEDFDVWDNIMLVHGLDAQASYFNMAADTIKKLLTKAYGAME